MTQRNPMNDRYRGDGPEGKTKKSATSAKPVSAAASSVHIAAKPVTRQEKRAAAKQREKQAQARAAERQKKAAAKAALAKADAEQGDPDAMGAKKGKGKGEQASKQADKPKETFFQRLTKPNPAMPDTPEYHKWKRIYWISMAAGIVSVIVSWLGMSFGGSTGSGTTTVVTTVFMIFAYIFIIGALVIDFTKVRKMVRAHQSNYGTDGKKSPKQVKHEQEAAARAAQLEADRKAARAAKHRNRRPAHPAETTVPGEQDVDKALAPGEAAALAAATNGEDAR